MAWHNELGKEGELLARKYLVKKRYKILQTNWKLGNIEVDIIAQTKKTIVFVEVKTRSSEVFQLPEQAVDLHRQRRLTMAADSFMKQFSDKYEARFDIIAVVMENGNTEIRHTIDAFCPVPRYY